MASEGLRIVAIAEAIVAGGAAGVAESERAGHGCEFIDALSSGGGDLLELGKPVIIPTG